MTYQNLRERLVQVALAGIEPVQLLFTLREGDHAAMDVEHWHWVLVRLLASHFNFDYDKNTPP